MPDFPSIVPNLIDGQMVSTAAQLQPVYDPSTGHTVAELAEADASTVSQAVEAARRSFSSEIWSGAPVAERQRVLYDCAQVILEHGEELAQLETLCAGIPIAGSSRRHVEIGAGWLQYFAERIGSWSGAVHNQAPGATTLVINEPRGVAAQFSPWNVPIGLALLKVSAAISVGNSVVLKPSEQTPLGILRAIELLHSAGLPPGVVNLVNGRGPVTGAALAQSQDIDCVSFTGGGVAGRAVAQAAAARFLPCVLELGGKSAVVIFEDADLDLALEAALLSAFGNNGQACLAGSRILVQASIADEFIDRFVARVQRMRIGDPFDPSNDLGPMASASHRDYVVGFVDKLKADGDELLTGGRALSELEPGYYVEPMVALCHDPSHSVAQQEIFGPFATFLRFADEKTAFRIANSTRYGLLAYLWTRDQGRALRGYQQLRAGSVVINGPMLRERNAPFGGIGDSGMGSEGGDYSLRFYSQEKTVVMAQDWQPTRRIGAT
ncbi:MAG: aldehyde dehydrogenase family protein [Gammaproteobacteria bacterium]|nr:aldehyde dehydrogenase family protein [Gammaproteobacteria bacterium]